MGSLDSSIRSAARATSSAYKRLPIRWRLAGGSAALTLVILCGFAAIVGVLTTRQIHDGLQPPGGRRAPTSSSARPSCELALRRTTATRSCGRCRARSTSTTSPRPQDAAIRVITDGDYVGYGSRDRARLRAAARRARAEIDGWRVETRAGRGGRLRRAGGRSSTRSRISDVQATANRVKVFLAFGVLGGALLALLAGLATARRAMEPIAELTAAAREVERSRDPSVRIPRPSPRTRSPSWRARWRRCSRALGEARAETEGDAGPPARVRRRRLARAAHAADLRAGQPRAARGGADGEQREAAASALRSSRRMRRLVADLLLLARADAGRVAPHEPVDLSEVVTDAAVRARARGRRPRDLDRRARRAPRSTAPATSCTGSCST